MKKKIIGVITARMKSNRLPGKVMRDLAGKSVFEHHVERLRSVSGVDGMFLASSSERTANESLIREAERLNVPYYEGAIEDVLERHEKIMNKTGADAILRMTCDMPLFDIETLEDYVKAFHDYSPDYIYPGNFNLLSGTMTELISAKAITKSHKYYRGPAITKYIIENPDEFKMHGVTVRNDICRNDVRLDLDFPEDLELIGTIYKELYDGRPIRLEDVYRFLDDNPSLIQINRNRVHNEAFAYGQCLLYKPLFQVTRCGDGFVILDEMAQSIEYDRFLEELERMFGPRAS